MEAALHRELAEELGATVSAVSQVFLVSSPADGGVSVQHIFAARLAGIDEQARTGAEYTDPSRGGYELDHVDLRGDALAGIDLKPAALKEFILANRAALLVEASPPLDLRDRRRSRWPRGRAGTRKRRRTARPGR
ncbi:MAG: NUDIX hydrolase [Pseudonocardia sp.]